MAGKTEVCIDWLTILVGGTSDRKQAIAKYHSAVSAAPFYIHFMYNIHIYVPSRCFSATTTAMTLYMGPIMDCEPQGIDFVHFHHHATISLHPSVGYPLKLIVSRSMAAEFKIYIILYTCLYFVLIKLWQMPFFSLPRHTQNSSSLQPTTHPYHNN